MRWQSGEERWVPCHGGTRRKPKRFEVLKKKGTTFEEFHIELDGAVRNTSLLGDAVVA
jgi:hypothetical protein